MGLVNAKCTGFLENDLTRSYHWFDLKSITDKKATFASIWIVIIVLVNNVAIRSFYGIICLFHVMVLERLQSKTWPIRGLVAPARDRAMVGHGCHAIFAIDTG